MGQDSVMSKEYSVRTNHEASSCLYKFKIQQRRQILNKSKGAPNGYLISVVKNELEEE